MSITAKSVWIAERSAKKSRKFGVELYTSGVSGVKLLIFFVFFHLKVYGTRIFWNLVGVKIDRNEKNYSSFKNSIYIERRK